MSAGTTGRAEFVARIAETFERAGVEYVFLNATEPTVDVDSDVDLAVTRESLATVDQLARAGYLGKLIQRSRYDVPWCWWYVFASDETGRLFRQLDVACDPWGVGRYGATIEHAVRSGRVVGSIRVPSPAAEAAYIVAKRAMKGLRSSDAQHLRQRVRAAGDEGAAVLEREFGIAGRTVAVDAQEATKPLPLREVEAEILGRRRKPTSSVRRFYFQIGRGFERMIKPTGLVIHLVGPDGSGKTAVASRLEVTTSGLFRRVSRLHFGPGVLPPPGRVLRREPDSTTQPHARAPSSSPVSLLRALYLWADAVGGWIPKVGVPVMRSSLVIVERGWLDLLVDPQRYRVKLPNRPLLLLWRLQPRPDLVVRLQARVSDIYRRKQELSPEEIDRQLAAWAEITTSGSHVAIVDTSGPTDASAAEVLRLASEGLARRVKGLEVARPVIEALGGIAIGGSSYQVVRVRGQARWLLPRRVLGGSPLRWHLYRGARRRDVFVAGALGAVRRVTYSVSRDATSVDLARGISAEIADVLGLSTVELAAALPRSLERGERALIAVRSAGHIIAFGKLNDRPDELDHERRVLEALAAAGPRHFVVPEVVGRLNIGTRGILLLRPIPTPGRALRDLGEIEFAALAELGALGDEVASTFGVSPDLRPSHGDFAPWNCARLPDGRLALWDWESARLASPFRDVFHWRLQVLRLFGVGSPQTLVTGALYPDAPMLRLADALGVPYQSSICTLRDVLEDARAENHEAGSSVVDAALNLLQQHLQ